MDENLRESPAFGACEFSYLVRAEDVPPKGAHIKFEADAKACEKLAVRLNVDDVADLAVEAQMTPFGKRGLMAIGKISGRVLQQCGVTLQPLWTALEVDFTTEFQPRDIVMQYVVPEDDFEAEVPEIIDDGAVDLGEVATQIFAMEVPVYPRAPDAEFDDIIDADDVEEEKPSPFAALQALKTTNDDA